VLRVHATCPLRVTAARVALRIRRAGYAGREVASGKAAKLAGLGASHAKFALHLLSLFPRVRVASFEAVAHGGKAALKVQTAIAADADAWVFPRLSLPGNVNLADYSAIELWSYVAPGGEAPPVLMLQLVEDGGGTWAISGLRSLAEPGWKRTLAMLDSAQPTSWGRDPDGKLDLSKVRTLLLGWGGYTGRPGEELTFWLDDIAAARW